MITKFRCRDLKTHEIVAYEVIQDNTWMVSHDDTFEKWSRGTWWVDCIREQFTGLLDKNGKEIYEGDIQKIVRGNFYWIYVVKHLGGRFGNILFSVCIEHNATNDGDKYTLEVSKGECLLRDYVKSGEEVEIIGNIYENPDLISPEK